jgi:hypothetical protein
MAISFFKPAPIRKWIAVINLISNILQTFIARPSSVASTQFFCPAIVNAASFCLYRG